MDRMDMPARTPLKGLLVLLALAGCSSGRTGSSGPEPVGRPAGTATAATRVMEVPAMEAFDRAVAKGTRLRSGAPGPRYWQQWADYRLEAELNPVSKRLTGQGRDPVLQSVARHPRHRLRPAAAQHLRPGQPA